MAGLAVPGLGDVRTGDGFYSGGLYVCSWAPAYPSKAHRACGDSLLRGTEPAAIDVDRGGPPWNKRAARAAVGVEAAAATKLGEEGLLVVCSLE